ncbi:DoxX family protein [Rhodococcus erythropolis R138]|uniref:DoxX family protein n=1 Tax=Rhodococcus erythropolis TaxID=1833 RepID=UPI0004923555|nr:DoxX family protein [Rhodococcus erythropolis]ALU70789.1 DoxX family protein [Rhodococcus erythropolis R138]MCZ4569628.1 DoxX family membrane protein [Rhodococcus erythropolis]MQP34203.1 DoxX family membrane protein [Rhodococcus erythropolis]
MLVRRIARPLLSTIFIAGGIDALRNPAQRAAKASPLIDKSVETLPGAVTQKVPADPETLVKINAAVQIGGGALLATGKAPRLASLVLAGSLVPTTLAGHDFWNETDPSLRAMQRTNFIKNVSLLGGLMIASVDTEGKPSLGWRGRRAAKKAQTSIAAALPLVASQTDHTSDRVEHALSVASERGSELAETAKAHGTDWLELAKERSSEFAEIASKRAAEFGEVAKERGPDILEVAQKRGSELAETARERSAELAELASKRSSEFAELALEKSNEWAETASEQTEVLGKRARKRAEKALEKARAKKDELTH